MLELLESAAKALRDVTVFTKGGGALMRELLADCDRIAKRCELAVWSATMARREGDLEVGAGAAPVPEHAPPGPWIAKPWISDPEEAKLRLGRNSQSAMLNWWRVLRGGMHTGAPQPSGAFETEAQAVAVRDALNRLESRGPVSGTAPPSASVQAAREELSAASRLLVDRPGETLTEDEIGELARLIGEAYEILGQALRVDRGAPPPEPVDELRRFAEGDTRPIAQTHMTAGAEPPKRVIRMKHFADGHTEEIIEGAGGIGEAGAPMSDSTFDPTRTMCDNCGEMGADVHAHQSGSWWHHHSTCPAPNIAAGAAPRVPREPSPEEWESRVRVERNVDWEGGWVIHFPTHSIGVASLAREQSGGALRGEEEP